VTERRVNDERRDGRRGNGAAGGGRSDDEASTVDAVGTMAAADQEGGGEGDDDGGTGGPGDAGGGAGRSDAPRYGSRAERRGWYWYDWANSAFYTTVITVFGGRYLNGLAEAAADPGGFVHPLGIPVHAGSLYAYMISISAIFQVILMPIVGAIADRTGKRRTMLTWLVAVGAAATVAFGFVTGGDYLIAGLLLLVATVAFACSIVVYYSFLPQLAAPDERDRVSSHGWAFGYLGSGLLLVANLVLFQLAEGDRLPFTAGTAAQISIVSAGIWWLVFTLISQATLRDSPPVVDSGAGAGSPVLAMRTITAGFRQLGGTLAQLRLAPTTLLFLAAFLLYNDGIQTVITQSSVYADAELGLPASTAIVAVLLVQFVAMVGAWLLGVLAERFGAKRVVLASLVVWTAVVGYAFFMPAGEAGQFYLLAVLIGLVLGGSQALSRSLFSHMAPKGKEAEYFSLYEISDKGTSWLGSLLFGLALQFTGSYRSAIVSLVVFFVLGIVLLARTNVRAAAAEAGNPAPARM
jgi:UMF1 family MFS transporter